MQVFFGGKLPAFLSSDFIYNLTDASHLLFTYSHSVKVLNAIGLLSRLTMPRPYGRIQYIMNIHRYEPFFFLFFLFLEGEGVCLGMQLFII